MGVFDKASLALVPDGIKDGKLYSVKPTDGSGDFTFTRGSNLAATRVDENGLIEKGRENLLLQSNAFNGSEWTKGNFSFLENQADKDGGTTAWKATCSTNYNYLGQNVSGNGVYTFSGYFRKGDSNEGVRFNFSALTDTNVYIDLTDGSSTDNGNLIYKSITDAGNGFYKVVISANISSLAIVRFFITNGSTTQVSGNIYIQDVQLEQGLVATDYIETGATTAQAGVLEDLPRINYSGSTPSLLMEPSRTNLITNSEYYNGWTQSGTTLTTNTTETLSPEGLYNASKLVGNGTTGVINSGIAKTGSVVVSVYLKSVSGSVNVTFKDPYGGLANEVKSVTTEWQRFDFIGDNGFSFAGFWIDDIPASGIYMWGAQLEEGSYPTSYIPTYGTSVTRGAEIANTVSIPSLIGQTEGTFFLDFEYTGYEVGLAYNWIALESENGHERILIYKNPNPSDLLVYLSAKNSMVFVKSIATISANTRYKIAFRYSTGDQVIYLNGILKHTSTHTYTRDSDLSRVTFNESNNPASCRVHQAVVLKGALSNDELAALTTL